MTKRIVLIHGAPGTGKSTLVERLRKDLTVPIIEKDAIKEFYFDYIGVGDQEHSRILGRASSDAMFSLARLLLKVEDAVVLENAFYADLAPKDIKGIAGIVDFGDVQFLEVYCSVNEPERMRRFAKRAASDRHIGHGDATNADQAGILDRYRPMNIGKTIMVDMTERDYKRDDDITRAISDFIKGDDHETN